MSTELYESEIRDTLAYHERALQRKVAQYMALPGNGGSTEARIHPKRVQCYTKASTEHVDLVALHLDPRNVLTHIVVVESAADTLAKRAWALLDSYKSAGYNGIYFSLLFDATVPQLTSTLVLYFQTRDNIFDELRANLDLLQHDNASGDKVRAYLISAASSLFT